MVTYNLSGDCYIDGWLRDCCNCTKGKKCSNKKQLKLDDGDSCKHYSMIPIRCLKAIVRGVNNGY